MAEHELGTGQEPFVRWMDESASVMLTIPPASDKIQQPLSFPLLHFLVYRKYSENVVLIKLSRDASECEASVVTCSANISLSTPRPNISVSTPRPSSNKWIMESLSLYFHVFSTFNGKYTSVATSDGRCGAVTLSLPLNTDVLLEMHMARNVRDEKKISFIHLSLVLRLSRIPLSTIALATGACNAIYVQTMIG